MSGSQKRRRHVGMDALWKMPVEVPVSLLLQDRDYAWTCGQLSLDADGNVVHAGELVAQSRQVCDYIVEILGRAELPASSVQRALLYYIHRSDSERDTMLDTFRARLGSKVIFDPIPIPHFYYDGIVLEVDLFCGVAESPSTVGGIAPGPVIASTSGDVTWVRFEALPHDLEASIEQFRTTLGQIGMDQACCLSEHWFAPFGTSGEIGSRLQTLGWGSKGFVVDAGPIATVSGLFVFVRSRSEEQFQRCDSRDDVVVTVRTSGEFAWLQGRSVDGGLGLVEQTRRIMTRLGRDLRSLGVEFADVAKATAHYVGEATPEDLHGNMTVRNDHYSKPGLASTGLPVFGFSDPTSKIAVDITVYSPKVRQPIG